MPLHLHTNCGDGVEIHIRPSELAALQTGGVGNVAGAAQLSVHCAPVKEQTQLQPVLLYCSDAPKPEQVGGAVTRAPPTVRLPLLTFTLPVSVVAPVTDSVLPNDAAPVSVDAPLTISVLFNVAAPVTPSVLPADKAPESVDAPVTASVPATAVLPLAAATVNLLPFTLKSLVSAVAPVTDSAPVMSAALPTTVAPSGSTKMVDTDDDVLFVLLLPGVGAGAVQALPTAVKPNSQPQMKAPLLLNCSL